MSMPITADQPGTQAGTLFPPLTATPSFRTVGSGLRLPSVDALRGLVMIIMALDHTREFVNSGAMVFQPEDLSRTTVPLFFTRWVTHICAPVFSFTAGLAARLWMSHGRTPAQLSAVLWKRGVWLAIVDLTVMRFALTFSMVHGVERLFCCVRCLPWVVLPISTRQTMDAASGLCTVCG